MLLTHQNAEWHYTEIRRTVLDLASKQFPASAKLEFRLFDEPAFSASKMWALSNERRVNWDWMYSYPAFKFRHPKRFELALWHNGQLVSMTLGRTTRNSAGVRLDFIEASPHAREVKVFLIVLAVMQLYAQAVGATEVRVVNPINADVRKYYEKFGLTYVSKGDYLFMKINSLL